MVILAAIERAIIDSQAIELFLKVLPRGAPQEL
jgi:hypothetical protein